MNKSNLNLGAAVLAASLGACTEENPARWPFGIDAGGGSVDAVVSDADGSDAGDTGVEPVDATQDRRDAILVLIDSGNVDDLGLGDDAQVMKDSGAPTDAEVLPPDSAIAPPDAGQIAQEVCDDGRDNNENGLVDCDDPSCAEAPAVEVTFGQNGAVLTMFGQQPEVIEGSATRSLSCEAYNFGVPFNFIISGRENDVQTQIQVRSAIADAGVGIWVFDNAEPVQFHNGGQQPQGEPSVGIVSGGYGPNGQAYEGFFPYRP